ncbi:hypothetical protein DdX_15964 [Ditylenchus destructor]|uniref:Uncharacterized protein n=1 Tax=Ditylenchus destructor TaxID=166010 RepID=A0AAD4QUA7_9BILA|nr:hypothetical protein DdX_15964 [Ditylenchus destructor]
MKSFSLAVFICILSIPDIGTCFEIESSIHPRNANGTDQDPTGDGNVKRIQRRFSPLETDVAIIHKEDMPIPENQIFMDEVLLARAHRSVWSE